MLAILLGYFTISEANFSDVIKEKTGKIVVVKFWNRWCHRSMEFAPMWDSFVGDDGYNERIEFGDVECSENMDLCNRMIGTTYPQVMWMEPDLNITVRFDGNRTISNLKSFLLDMEMYPLEVAEDENVVGSTDFDPVVVLRMKKKDKGTLKQVRNMLASLPGRKGKLIFGESRALRICRGSDICREFDGEWSGNDVTDFMERGLMSRCEELNERVIHVLRRTNMTFVHVVVDRRKRKNYVRDLVQSLPPYQFTYSIHPGDEEILRELGLSKVTPTMVVHVNPVSRRLELYKGEVTARQLSVWIVGLGKAGKWARPVYLAFVVGVLAVGAVIMQLMKRSRKTE